MRSEREDLTRKSYGWKGPPAAAKPGDKPPTFQGDLRRLPAALAPLVKLPHWVLWRLEWRRNKKGKGKWTKEPYQPNGNHAKTDDPSTWSNYAGVIGAVQQFDGIGFCLRNSGLAAFDIDHCRDPSTGALDAWAAALVERAGSYSEITPSGAGLRIIGLGTGPKVHRKQPVADGVSLEAYRGAERYITITGAALPGTDRHLADLDALVDSVVAELDAQKGQKHSAPASTEESRGEDGDDDAPARSPADLDLDVLIREGCGKHYDGDRSRALFAVINELLRRGYQPPAIERVILDPQNGISEHVLEQSNPVKYAQRQVARAVRQVDLARDKYGLPHSTSNNIRVALLKMGIKLSFEQFASRMLIEGLPNYGPTIDDAAVTALWFTIEQKFKFRPSYEHFYKVVTNTARLNAFHAVRLYLDGLKWDGAKRLDTWLTDYGGAENNEYTRAVGALMLIAAVRRVRQPGCKFDEMVVLENETQGTNKSTALSVLAVREEWFSDDLPLNADSKKVIEQLSGIWILEAAELSGMKRADVEHLKAMLSRRIDRARLAYGRIGEERPRQCIMVGTTNNRRYLRDATGNRRFWPVAVKKFELEKLRLDRDQLWAEATVREAAGASIRLDPQLWPKAEEQQEERRAIDPWEDRLADHLEGRQGKLEIIDAWRLVGVEPGQQTQDQNQRLGIVMKRLGWERGRRRKDNRLTYAYIKGKKNEWLKVDYVTSGRYWRVVDKQSGPQPNHIAREQNDDTSLF
jgi:hypothetical protein